MALNKDMIWSRNVSAAIRAEVARRNRRGSEVQAVIGLGRNATYERLRGDKAFDMTEIEAIAIWLGIDVQVIFDSAALSERAAA